MSLKHLSFADLHALKCELKDLQACRHRLTPELEKHLDPAIERLAKEITDRIFESAFSNLK